MLLTGASGFVGSAILPKLLARGYDVRILTQRKLDLPAGVDQRIADLTRLTPQEAAAFIAGMDAVLHAAGYAHATGDADPERHDRINRSATTCLAEAAAEAGAFFVYLSSIKAQIAQNHPPIVQEDDDDMPGDPYGIAKHAAECAIRAALPGRHVILRPVLVCGPGAKGHLLYLLKLSALPIPLPFGAFEVARSMISREDLACIGVDAMTNRAFAGKTLIVADPVPLTLPQMITQIRAGLSRPPGLIRVPQAWIAAGLRGIGRGEIADRLIEPLVAVPEILLKSGWKPVQPVNEALREMARHWAAHSAGVKKE